MKLIRCKSNVEGFCEFNNSINSDVLLGKNSKIALKNISWVKENFLLSIDNSNNKIKLDFTNPVDNSTLSTEGFLTTGRVYSRLNFNSFLIDIGESINNSLKITIPKNIGLSFDCFQSSTDSKLKIESNQNSKIDFFVPDGDTTTDQRNINCEVQGVGNGVYGRKAPNGIPNGYNSALFCIDNLYFFRSGRGCGVFNFQAARFELGDPGLVLGLTSIEPTDLGQNFEPTIDKYDFAIVFNGQGMPYDIIQRDSTTGVVSKTQANINGNIVGDENVNNDILEISMNSGKIEGRVYSQAVPDGTLLFSQIYQNDLDVLYPVAAIHTHGTRIQNLRYTPKPIIEEVSISQPLLQNSSLSIRPPSQNRNAVDMTITFQSKDIIEFLGFKNLINHADRAVEPFIKADFTPRLFDTTEAYVVILDSVNISSYDYSDDQQKKRNILSLIQNMKNTKELDVSYIESNPVFINIKNNNPINLKNIKIRVLTNDNQRVGILGHAELCLLIDE